MFLICFCCVWCMVEAGRLVMALCVLRLSGSVLSVGPVSPRRRVAPRQPPAPPLPTAFPSCPVPAARVTRVSPPHRSAAQQKRALLPTAALPSRTPRQHRTRRTRRTHDRRKPHNKHMHYPNKQNTTQHIITVEASE